MQQESRHGVIREGLAGLLCCPGRRWIGGNIDVQDSSVIVTKKNKDIEHLECDRRYGEEVTGNNLIGMVGQECPPGLRWRLGLPGDVLCDR